MTRPGIELQSPGPLVNTLLIRPMTNLTLQMASYTKDKQRSTFSLLQVSECPHKYNRKIQMNCKFKIE